MTKKIKIDPNDEDQADEIIKKIKTFPRKVWTIKVGVNTTIISDELLDEAAKRLANEMDADILKEILSNENRSKHNRSK